MHNLFTKYIQEQQNIITIKIKSYYRMYIVYAIYITQ